MHKNVSHLLLGHALEERRRVVHIVIIIKFGLVGTMGGREPASRASAQLPLLSQGPDTVLLFLLGEIGHGLDELLRVLETSMRTARTHNTHEMPKRARERAAKKND
jgi:hypothetical protein